MAGPALVGWAAIGTAGRAALKKFGMTAARKQFPNLFKKVDTVKKHHDKIVPPVALATGGALKAVKNKQQKKKNKLK